MVGRYTRTTATQCEQRAGDGYDKAEETDGGETETPMEVKHYKTTDTESTPTTDFSKSEESIIDSP